MQLFIFRSAPYGNSLAREALDMALAAAAFGQEVAVVFCQDGLFQLLEQQQSTAGAPHLGAIEAMPLYDIEGLYYLHDDLAPRQLSNDALAPLASGISTAELQTLINDASRVQSF